MSVCCITYNHEHFIMQALEGFLMQKTDFKYEIIICDDFSTDNSRKILAEYAEKYPDIIRVVFQTENVGSIRNFVRTLSEAKGKYIALCDGDDYWTDPLKLQRQVEFMESHKDCSICCHYTRVINESGELVYENPSPVPLDFTYEDVLLGRKEETRISSMLVKNNYLIKRISKQQWLYNTHSTDTFLKLYIIAHSRGKIYVMPEVMSIYRLHKNGVWSLIDAKVRKSKMISDFNILINNFNYSTRNKRKLLMIYIRQYLLFEIKNLNIQNAMKTIKTLV
ncbi:glycosyltransferase [Pseudoxanthomonas sp. SGD-10]|nr:glycosyltransferase [Pseudoxanthomonas sp. SGD-10]